MLFLFNEPIHVLNVSLIVSLNVSLSVLLNVYQRKSSNNEILAIRSINLCLNFHFDKNHILTTWLIL